MGEVLMARLQQAQIDAMTRTPEQRYLDLVAHRPDLLQRVPQYHIASFLGIQPETLSRIRGRLARRR
jgi:CRP-like cAMP-binding protein